MKTQLRKFKLLIESTRTLLLLLKLMFNKLLFLLNLQTKLKEMLHILKLNLEHLNELMFSQSLNHGLMKNILKLLKLLMYLKDQLSHSLNQDQNQSEEMFQSLLLPNLFKNKIKLNKLQDHNQLPSDNPNLFNQEETNQMNLQQDNPIKQLKNNQNNNNLLNQKLTSHLLQDTDIQTWSHSLNNNSLQLKTTNTEVTSLLTILSLLKKILSVELFKLMRKLLIFMTFLVSTSIKLKKLNGTTNLQNLAT